jgi:hypothetical protein
LEASREKTKRKHNDVAKIKSGEKIAAQNNDKCYGIINSAVYSTCDDGTPLML